MDTTKHRNQLGDDIAAALFEAERTASAALAANARLQAAIIEAQIAGGFAIKVGAAAATAVANAGPKLAGAREDLVAAHHHLEVARRATRVEVTATGGGDKPPENNSIDASGREALRRVA